MDYPDFDLEKLKQESEDAQNQKALLGVVGNIAQGFANVPSSYELLKGKSIGPTANPKAVLDSAASAIQDPWEKQKKTYEMYKAAKEGEALKDQTDANSTSANALRGAILQRYPNVDPKSLEGLNAKQLIAVHGDPGKLNEIQAQSEVNFNNEKALKQMDEGYRSREKELDRKNDMEKALLRQQLAEADKNLPQNVYSAATYGQRLDDADKQMSELLSKYDPTTMKNAVVSKFSPEFLKPENMKLMDQAQRNFINAVLRRESGSAISQSEFDSGNKQYFPQPGDSQAVLDQKARNRAVAIAGMKAEGAKALPKLGAQLQASAQTSNPKTPSGPNIANAKRPKTVIQNGHTYILNEQTGEYE